MGYQSQEQTAFDGLVTTGAGTTVPRWSAADEVNIDHQFRTIRGREPSTRVADHELPQIGYFLDGVAGVASMAPGTAAITSVGSTAFTFRIYVGGVNASKLAAYSANTKFCIVDWSANSTVAIASPLSGFHLYFNVFGSDLDLSCAFRTATGLGVLNISDVGSDEFASPQDFKCIEFSRDTSNNYKLRIFSDETTKENEASTTDSNTLTTTTLAVMKVGAYSDTGTNAYENHGEFICGGVEIIDATTGDATSTYDRFKGKDRSDLPADYEFIWFPELAVGYTDYAANQSNSSVVVALRPRAPQLNASEIQVYPESWGRLNIPDLRLGLSSAAMIMLRADVNEQVLNSAEPPWLLTAPGLFLAVNEDGANFEVTMAVSTVDSDGNPTASDSVQTAVNLGFGNVYTYGIVYIPNQSAGTCEFRFFVDLNGDGTGWTYIGTTGSKLGRTPMDGEFYFASNASQDRWVNASYKRFAVFNNLETIPAASSGGASTIQSTYDAFPADGGPLWPPKLVTFFRSTSEFVRQKDTGNDQDAFDRVTAWTGEFNPRHVIEWYPQNGVNRWSAFRGITRANRPELKGVHPSVETISGQTTKYINYLIDGAVYRYDQTNDSGKLLQHPAMAGCPCSGVTSIDNGKDRLFMCGTNFTPVKVFPGGVGSLGLDAPQISMAEQSTQAGTGNLSASSTYYFKATLYNSQTGEESNANPNLRTTVTTGVGHDEATLRISQLYSRARDDWDTIRIYRLVPDEGLNEYYLEAEVPRPRLLPPAGDDIDITVGMSDAELLLQSVLEDDNDPPPEFSAAALAARILYVGGGGTNPGWVYYSKPLFTESFPPLNIFQLDNDQSNSVQAIVPIFGRLLILKERGIWGGQDNIGEIAQEPALLHSDRGLVAKQAWAVADNTVFFMSPDRCVYATDGIEIQDVSTSFIKDTLFNYSEAQLSDVQAVHDARSKSIWFSIPKSSTQSGADREVLVYRYDARRWQRYEMPHDSLATGHYESTSGSFGGFAYRGSFYRLENGQQNRESDAGSGESTFTYDYDTNDANESLVLSGSQVLGVVGQTREWDSSIEGMPLIVVPHDTAYDPADPESYHPLWDESDDSRIYNYVRGVRTDGSDYYLWFGERFESNARYLWVGVGFQFRRYESQWITPQGEDRPHMIYGNTFVHNGEHARDDTNPRFKYAADYEAFATGGWRQKGNAVRFPDTNHQFRRRARRFKFQIVEGNGRGDKFEITRIAWRYRVRGPRRKR